MNFDEIFAIFLESYKELLLDSITGYDPIETQQKNAWNPIETLKFLETIFEKYRNISKYGWILTIFGPNLALDPSGPI